MPFSSGFITLFICGLLIVIAPSVLMVWRLWGAGGNNRVMAAMAVLVAVAMAVLAFVGTESPQPWEEAILSFFLLWGVSFYLLIGLAAVSRALQSLVRPPSQPDRPTSESR